MAPEIKSLIDSWNPDGDNNQENLSAFAATLLDGTLCFLEDNEPDDETSEKIFSALSNFYKITEGDSPNSSLIKLWAWSEDDATSYTNTVDELENSFLPLLGGDYFIGGYANENSRQVGDGNAYICSKEGKVIPIAELAECYFLNTKAV
ncbi:hypothetical protein OAZ06_03170 [Synechococcus sp. AH-736-G20]|nr:hypothetical protein [Synechococcus sp. AH-736-G20]